jgi:beta-glucosidase/6-phospho-beta-glucosidase/beta-galactosidase
MGRRRATTVALGSGVAITSVLIARVSFVDASAVEPTRRTTTTGDDRLQHPSRRDERVANRRQARRAKRNEHHHDDDDDDVVFDDGSIFDDEEMLTRFGVGARVSAWTTEGDGGRRPRSVWDEFVETLGEDRALEAQRGIEFYERFKDDVAMMKRHGVDEIDVSLSWPRLMTASGSPREDGFEFYAKMFEALKTHDIRARVTLFDKDMPVWACDEPRRPDAERRPAGASCESGWLSKETIKDFELYADAVFDRFGSEVKHWITINEPRKIAELGYGTGTHAPGRKSVKEQLLVGHNLLLAHARIAKLYRAKYYSQHGGQVAINLNCAWVEAASGVDEDKWASQDALDEEVGWFAAPIFYGDYPESMRMRHGKLLPVFTEAEMNDVLGSVDYLAITYENTLKVHAIPDDAIDSHLGFSGRPQPWDFQVDAEDHSEGLAKLLTHLTDAYGDPKIVVNSRGISTTEWDNLSGNLEDTARINFMDEEMNAIQHAIRRGVTVRAYFYRSMFDAFEWSDGNTKKFGLVYVDHDGKFGEPMRRYPRKSLEAFAHFSNTNRDLATLGKTQMRLRTRTQERRLTSFNMKREGEIIAIQGMAVIIGCVCAASFALGIGANKDRSLATLEGERAPLM